MGETYWIITVVLAVLIGIVASLRITEHYLTKSNNVGDYVGKFYDFSREFEVVGGVSYLKSQETTPEIQRIQEQMRRRREEAKKDRKVNGRIFN
ncbi:MAG: hypothetical protein J6Y20_12935 [Lachnospiraceae bacterium]|nr:hypothetical protein [Lachnospiraceae bacterium]